MSHMLMPIDEFAQRVRPLTDQEVKLAVANVQAGNCCMICQCSTWVLCLEWSQAAERHADHVEAVVRARRV